MRYKDIVVDGRAYRLGMLLWTGSNMREIAETLAAYHKDVICAENEQDQLLAHYTRRSDGYRFARRINPGREFVFCIEEQ